MSDNHTGLSHDMPEYVPNVPPERYSSEPWEPRTVLMVGGPADGQWRAVGSRTFEVAEIPKLTFSTTDTDAIIERFIHHRYHVDRMAMFGFDVWIAVCERQFMGSTERNKAVLRALLQRDVAREMGVL